MKYWGALSLVPFACLCASIAAAQVLPVPGPVNPRLQTVQWQPGQEVLLTALPQSGLTVVLEPGERINRVVVSDQSAFDVKVSAELDSFLILPLRDEAAGSMLVSTDRREYRFGLRSDTGLTAAYLVRFEYGDSNQPVLAAIVPEVGSEIWAYRLKGDREVRPAEIRDDGIRTRIEFAPDQALPAVFAIGPTGDEQVVNGYMRGETYVIDRVHQELVFRIDKKKSTARRNDRPEVAG